VRVNAILLGIVDTAMQEEVLAGVAPMRGLSAADWSKVRNAAVPLGRGSSPEECAGQGNRVKKFSTNRLSAESVEIH
jgi:NAD(P)-dependent dehydrogenase (short-subunit alcohol dehydrogenase family)